jgi:hypothetical protein
MHDEQQEKKPNLTSLNKELSQFVVQSVRTLMLFVWMPGVDTKVAKHPVPAC